MPEEDETFRCADAAGKLDKVPVAVLHDTGADHAGVPGPLDEDIGQDHVLHVDAKECHNGKYHDLARKGKHYINHAHDQLLRDPAEISG